MHITFHPVSLAELQYFMFDIAGDPALAKARAAELCSDESKCRKLHTLYSALERHLQQLSREGSTELSPFLSQFAAVISGFLHPYWYAGPCSFSLLFRESEDTIDTIRAAYPDSDGSIGTLFSRYLPGEHSSSQLIAPLPSLARGPLSGFKDTTQGLLTGPVSGSGYVDSQKLGTLLDISEWFFMREELITPTGLTALNRAKDYAQQHQLGLLEGSGVFDPTSADCASEPSNLRADVMGNATLFASMRERYYQ